MAGLALFAAVAADVVLHGRIAQADPALGARLAAPPGSSTWGFASVVSDAGSALVSVPVLVLLAALLLARGRRADAIRVAIAGAATELLAEGLKLAFARERPGSGIGLATGYAFPSGHASRAAMLATLAVWLAWSAGWRPRRVALVALAGAGWVALVAWSRLALDVHYVSDVIAGAGLGLGVAAAVVATSSRQPS